MRGGGPRPIQKGFIRFFGIICQKKWGFLYKETRSFFYHFSPKRRRESGPSKKKSFSEKAEVVKKGRGGVSVFCQKVKKQFFLCLTLSCGWLLDESTNTRSTSLSTSSENVNWNVPGKPYHLCLQGAMGSVVGDTFQKYSKNSQCLQHHVPLWPVTIDTAFLKVCPASLWAVEPSRPGALPFAWGCGQKT